MNVLAAKIDFRDCVKHSIYIVLLTAHENSLSLKNKLQYSFLKAVTERIDNLFRVTWVVNDELKFWTQAG